MVSNEYKTSTFEHEAEMAAGGVGSQQLSVKGGVLLLSIVQLSGVERGGYHSP